VTSPVVPSFAARVAATRRKLDALEGHLPGKHDQSSHGRKKTATPASSMLDDAHLVKAFTFSDPETGIRAEASVRRGRGIYVDITFRDRDGNRVGSARRAIAAHGKTVYHVTATLQENVRGQGFMTRFNSAAETHYRAAGVTEIELTAGKSVGGYAWAKAGYDFARQSDRSDVAVRAKGQLQTFDPAGRSAVQSVLSRPSFTPLEMAMAGWSAGATTWPGKKVMLGSEWDGVRKL
jgi:hypothetical protein